jgi:hypothetical protein
LKFQRELNDIMLEVRHCGLNEGPFGCLDGSGVVDMRRGVKRAQNAMSSEADLDEFIFSLSPIAKRSFVELLLGLLLKSDLVAVLTHGDIRPANIMGDCNGDYRRINGIID